MDPIFTEHHLEVARFCAIECELQVSGERSVHGMLCAWAYAQDQTKGPGRVLPDESDVLVIGRLIEPRRNAHGYREHGVRVGWDVKMPWSDVPPAMERLLASVDGAEAGEWFRAFEEIHPFGDGNGRSGQVLYNWLGNTLMAPVWAPNFWEDPRRHAGEGA